jgi:hypothetical protein
MTASLDTTLIENLPNPGNDMSAVAYSAPDVVINTAGRGWGNFSVNGVSALSNDHRTPVAPTNSGLRRVLSGPAAWLRRTASSQDYFLRKVCLTTLPLPHAVPEPWDRNFSVSARAMCRTFLQLFCSRVSSRCFITGGSAHMRCIYENQQKDLR